MKVRLMGEHQVITGSIKDLSILAGIYNPAKRSEWIYQVNLLNYDWIILVLTIPFLSQFFFRKICVT